MFVTPGRFSLFFPIILSRFGKYGAVNEVPGRLKVSEDDIVRCEHDSPLTLKIPVTSHLQEYLVGLGAYHVSGMRGKNKSLGIIIIRVFQ